MRVAVFVDGANFFFLQRDGLGWFADPRKILTYLARYGEVVDAYYYIGQQTQSDPRQQGYLDALPSMGYTVVTKPIKNIYDAQSGGYRRKANLDIEIVVDMFNTIDQYDMAILISGDGDFERALQLLRYRGKRVMVFSTEGYIAREIRNVVGGHYVDLATLRGDIEKQPVVHEVREEPAAEETAQEEQPPRSGRARWGGWPAALKTREETDT